MYSLSIGTLKLDANVATRIFIPGKSSLNSWKRQETKNKYAIIISKVSLSTNSNYSVRVKPEQIGLWGIQSTFVIQVNNNINYKIMHSLGSFYKFGRKVISKELEIR